MPRDAHTVARINRAVSDCVEEAYHSDAPLSVVARDADSYRDNGEWRPEEVSEFECAVLAILREVYRVQRDTN